MYQHAFQLQPYRMAPWTAPAGAPRTDVASAPSRQRVAAQASRQVEVQQSWERIFAAAQAAVNERCIEMSERPL